MTATVHYLAPPQFDSLPEALSWYAGNRRPLSIYAPPVDATGDEQADAWLAQVFAALTHPDFADHSVRIRHMLDKAADAQRVADECRKMIGPHPQDEAVLTKATAEYEAVARVLRKWVDDLNSEPVVVGMGGRA